MNTMNMPGFVADASLYKTSGHYQSVTTPSYSSSLEQRVVVSQIRAFGGLGGLSSPRAQIALGFQCSGNGCICFGDADCNDMFSTNVCGPSAVCFGSICICSR